VEKVGSIGRERLFPVASFQQGLSPRVVSSLPPSTVRGLAWAAHRLELRRDVSPIAKTQV
jgi:hypothetical protein